VYEAALDERRGRGRDLDVLHTNHVEVFDGTLARRDRLYQRGNILISVRNINTIAILDGQTKEILWCWGPTNVTFQHHPTLLPNGNILVFDNGHAFSEVLEVAPLTGRIVWQYGPATDFFTESRGSNQRLPNGNTLITDSDRGYVFEVTPDGEKVWEFANPEIDEKQQRQALWRMLRFSARDLPFVALR
jgi:outer membrane protein assembly factor BamB